MTLKDLSPDEDVLLAGFLREIIQADGDYSAAEQVHVKRLRDTLGEARFDRAIASATTRFTSRAALKDAAKAITRTESQLTIFAFLETVAVSDSVTPEEDRPLRWLASWWQIAR